MKTPLDLDFLVQLTRLGPITINPLDALVTKPLPEVLGPFARGPSFETDLEGKRWQVYPLRVPSGLGFVFDVRMLGKLEVGADDGRVRFTVPRALAEVAAANVAWPVEGPRVLPDGRADLWLTPTRGKVAVVGNERFGLGLRAA
jgi:hypothetical protein